MNGSLGTRYRVIQLGAPRPPHPQRNEPVTSFDSLVTHHPGDNDQARLLEGRVVGGQRGRSHALVGGEIQEIEVARGERTYGLKPDQVLLKKDFILEASSLSPDDGKKARNVDVPAPVAGYIGRIDQVQGLVDVYDREDGDVIARIRHLDEFHVDPGQAVVYGQSLGMQGRKQTGAIHVHMEVDTRYYQQYENYIADLASGRLAVEPEHRQGIAPLPVTNDGVLRVGESGARVNDVQRVLAHEGYRDGNGRPIEPDGVYRLSLQPAVLAFQKDHGLPQTGDIDPATLALAPVPQRREADYPDHTGEGRFPARRAPERDPSLVNPRHPDHPDWRPKPDFSKVTSDVASDEQPVRSHPNQPLSVASAPDLNDPERSRVRDPRDRDHPDHAMNEIIRGKLVALHAGHGIEMAGEKLERMTAAVALSSRERQMTRVDGVMFSVGNDGRPDVNGNLLSYQAVNGDPYHYATMRSATPVQQAQQTVPEDAYRQMAQATQQQAQPSARFEEQRQQAETQQRSGSGRVLA